jgi:hypothetical protein
VDVIKNKTLERQESDTPYFGSKFFSTVDNYRISPILHQLSSYNAYLEWCINHHPELKAEECAKSYMLWKEHDDFDHMMGQDQEYKVSQHENLVNLNKIFICGAVLVSILQIKNATKVVLVFGFILNIGCHVITFFDSSAGHSANLN